MDVLKLSVADAAKLISAIYRIESELIDERTYRFSKDHFVAWLLDALYQATRCLPEHLAKLHDFTISGRTFRNASSLSNALTDATNEEDKEPEDELASLAMARLELGAVIDRAFVRALAVEPPGPFCVIVEAEYAKQSFKRRIHEFLYSYCRTLDVGPENAFLGIAAFLNGVLDDLKSNVQMLADAQAHRARRVFAPRPNPRAPSCCANVPDACFSEDELVVWI
jgi:hypothetical protein